MAGGHLGGEQAGYEAVLVGGPDLAVGEEAVAADSSPTKPRVPSRRPSTDHLRPTGTSSSVRLRPLVTRSMMEDETNGFADAYFFAPVGAVGEEVLDADGEVVVGVEEAGGTGDDAVTVVIGVGRRRLRRTCLCWRSWRPSRRGWSSPCGFGRPVAGHEAEGGVYVRV